MPDRLTGDADDWWRVLSALEDRNVALDRVGKDVEENTAVLAGVREALSLRPTGRQIEYRRRRVTAGLLLYGVAIIWAHDQHVEHCGPGARVESAAQQRSYERPVLCDVSFPLHGHERGEFPTAWSLFGATLYGAAGVGVWTWVRRTRRDKGWEA